MRPLIWLGFAIVVVASCDNLVKNPAAYCDTTADCKNPMYPICDVADHVCTIVFDGGLDGSTDMAGCTNSAMCSDTAPICSTRVCRACSGSTDDAECAIHTAATPRCGSAGKCVVCRAATQAQDCTTATSPICDNTTSACRACAANAECSSGVCKPDGSCADPATVAYVNNASGACSDAVHASTLAAPYCQIQAAATTSGKPYVVVAGSATAYNAVSLSPTTSDIGPLTIIGPGRSATTAKVAQSGVAAMTVSVTVAHTVTVTVDGLEFSGSGTPTPAAGVSCLRSAGSANVTVKNSLIDNCGGAGVDSNGCTLAIDADIVSVNAGGGLKLASTSYTVTNSIISGNGSGAATSAGVSLDNASSGTFAFNTIAKNSVAAGVGGVDCGTGATKTLASSIVLQNTPLGGTQLGAQCTLSNVVTVAGDDNRGLMVATAPAFVSATDFHLLPSNAANTACCVDKVATDPGTANKDHDVDASKRPKGAGWDYGAHEVQ
jgi:hypothetical protein